tara:strand:+ start:4918 stop:5244 length:327 start_codon:yes stop_codon:yes gene_type:complete
MPRTLRALALTLLLASPLLSSGCATSGQLAFGDTPAAFGGTRLWSTALSHSADQVVNEANPSGLSVLLLVADLPLSLAADLVLLPVTIPMELSHEGETHLLGSDLGWF